VALYTSGMEHSPTSATGTAREPTPWRATRRAAWEALKKRFLVTMRSGLPPALIILVLASAAHARHVLFAGRAYNGFLG